jgi:SAM-dependent methyltransferase
VGTGAIRRLATQSGLAIEIQQYFSEELPFGADRFDLVFARAALHHTQDLGTACREFFRVLKPGGLLVAVREHVISRKKDLRKFQELHPLHARYGGENAFLIDDYLRAIRSAGFLVRSVLTPLRSPINYAPYDRRGLCKEVGSRLSLGCSWFGRLIAVALRPAPVWAAAVRVIELLDHRPGRLYSFVASKPE